MKNVSIRILVSVVRPNVGMDVQTYHLHTAVFLLVHLVGSDGASSLPHRSRTRRRTGAVEYLRANLKNKLTKKRSPSPKGGFFPGNP